MPEAHGVPSPVGDDAGKHLVLVPDGVWARGRIEEIIKEDPQSLGNLKDLKELQWVEQGRFLLKLL
ncbi:MAG: hypothetical protein EOP48_15075, partial [Sphingobacteriales bacterium]